MIPNVQPRKSRRIAPETNTPRKLTTPRKKSLGFIAHSATGSTSVNGNVRVYCTPFLHQLLQESRSALNGSIRDARPDGTAAASNATNRPALPVPQLR